jgi:predicted transcriptional regulator of viral defense system
MSRSTRRPKVNPPPGVIRARDAVKKGLSRKRLSELTRAGELERLARGVYTSANAEVTEHHTLVEAAARVPHGVVCLLSALRFHQLGTQQPHEVWVAIDRKAWKPLLDWPPVRLVRFSGDALEFGVEKHVLEGIPVHVTSREKTVADCFKYRNKLGLDVALEALREYLRSKKRSVDELSRAAKVCRVSRVMQPYLESLL